MKREKYEILTTDQKTHHVYAFSWSDAINEFVSTYSSYETTDVIDVYLSSLVRY